MHLHPDDAGRSSAGQSRRLVPVADRSLPADVREGELRRRVAKDVYRTKEVAHETARRILRSGDL